MKKFRYIIIGKRLGIGLLACLLMVTLGVFTVFGWDKTLTTNTNAKKLPIYCTDTTEKLVSLSFDAAWGNEDTQDLIDILDIITTAEASLNSNINMNLFSSWFCAELRRQK